MGVVYQTGGSILKCIPKSSSCIYIGPVDLILYFPNLEEFDEVVLIIVNTQSRVNGTTNEYFHINVKLVFFPITLLSLYYCE